MMEVDPLAPKNAKYYRSTEVNVLQPGDHIFRPMETKGYHHGVVVIKKTSSSSMIDYEIIDFSPTDGVLNPSQCTEGIVEKHSVHDFLVGCAHFGVLKYQNDNVNQRKHVIKTAKSYLGKKLNYHVSGIPFDKNTFNCESFIYFCWTGEY